MVGVGKIVQMNPAFVAVPPGVVTLTFPEEPAPTTAVMLVGESTVKDVAGVPPKVTAVTPVKSVPVMVTVCPLEAIAGAKSVTAGILFTVTLNVADLEFPSPSVTV